MTTITDKYVLFLNGIGSNWYVCEFVYKGENFHNSEQAFMWEKAIHFGDLQIASKILRTPEPDLCKALGRSTGEIPTLSNDTFAPGITG